MSSLAAPEPDAGGNAARVAKEETAERDDRKTIDLSDLLAVGLDADGPAADDLAQADRQPVGIADEPCRPFDDARHRAAVERTELFAACHPGDEARIEQGRCRRPLDAVVEIGWNLEQFFEVVVDGDRLDAPELVDRAGDRERLTDRRIRGVNEKIEGFFDACQITGFTGRQGVIIAATNVKHLMLRQDVVAAGAEERFHIFPVETVDQGLTLLTGIPAGEPDQDDNYPAGTLNQRIAARLDGFAAKAAELVRSTAITQAH